MIPKSCRWLRPGLLASTTAFIFAGGCKPTPPPPPTPTPTQPTPPPQPAPTPTPLAAPEVTPKPAIPPAPISGVLSGSPFEPASIDRDPLQLRFAQSADRSISLVFFGSPMPTSVSILDEVPFGSPHVHVRSGPSAAAIHMTGYRLILELDEAGGGIWLELPNGSGSLAGRFTFQASSPTPEP